MERLTNKEQLFLEQLKLFIKTYEYVPTIRELGRYVGLNSPATVYHYLKKLEEKDYIKRINNRNIIFIND